MKTLKLKDVEKEYKEKFKELLDTGENLNADRLIDLSVQLFNEFKANGINTDKDKDADMLLFQYGVYNWGGPKGEHFSFNITRQFIKNFVDEPYQLSVSLIFDPIEFKECDKYNCWSVDFDSLNEWVMHIKTTKGYKLANKYSAKLCEINYNQV